MSKSKKTYQPQTSYMIQPEEEEKNKVCPNPNRKDPKNSEVLKFISMCITWSPEMTKEISFTIYQEILVYKKE